MRILDCTLRDGGYYTNWDFDRKLVDTYMASMNELPVDYLEVGYRSNPMKGYFGEYFYSPVYVLERLKQGTNKKLVIILNEKDMRAADAEALLSPIKGLVDMVRLAIDPSNLARALTLAEAVKKLGFEVGFNVMYMSKWKEQTDFLNLLPHVDGLAEYFYLVDSYGGVFPEDVRATMQMVRDKTHCKLGFHGHNNLELGLINTLTAIEEGADIVDATITGMGRGAGNCKMELLLTTMNARNGMEVDFNALAAVVEGFTQLQQEHGWGTNLPYMVSGAHSLPQKEVMEWTTKKFYSFNSILQSLQNRKDGVSDNLKLPVLKPQKRFEKVFVIGGGPNAARHAEAMEKLIGQKDNACIIHASSKNAGHYAALEIEQYFCLVGNEGHRLEKNIRESEALKGVYVLPPFPREMGTYLPSFAKIDNRAFELGNVTFTDKVKDSHTVLALQLAIELGANQVYCIGYDGYSEGAITQLERALTVENERLFDDFTAHTGLNLIAITPTHYSNLHQTSIYETL